MTSFGCLASSSFMMDSCSPLIIRIENFLSSLENVFARMAADVIPSVSWWDMILIGLFLENSRNSFAKLSISFNIGHENLLA